MITASAPIPAPANLAAFDSSFSGDFDTALTLPAFMMDEYHFIPYSFFAITKDGNAAALLAEFLTLKHESENWGDPNVLDAFGCNDVTVAAKFGWSPATYQAAFSILTTLGVISGRAMLNGDRSVVVQMGTVQQLVNQITTS